jgi:hypothetical protein
METAKGNVVDDRSSSDTAGSYAAAHDEAQAFCQHNGRPVVVGTTPFPIVPSNQREIYSYGVSRFSGGAAPCPWAVLR